MAKEPSTAFGKRSVSKSKAMKTSADMTRGTGAAAQAAGASGGDGGAAVGIFAAVAAHSIAAKQDKMAGRIASKGRAINDIVDRGQGKNLGARAGMTGGIANAQTYQRKIGRGANPDQLITVPKGKR